MNTGAKCRGTARSRVALAILAVAVVAGWHTQAAVTDGLVGQWEFEEGAGLVAADTSGGNNDGDLMNFPDDGSQWVEGKFGGGILFGDARRVVVPDDPSIGSDLVDGFSVAAWFKSNVGLAAGSSTYAVLEKGNMYFLIQGIAGEGGGMNFLVKEGGDNRTVGIVDALDADTWYHVTGVFDGSEARVYLNGELKGSLAIANPMDETIEDLFIGGDDPGRPFEGVVDHVQIWNRALTADEVVEVAYDPAKEGAPVIVSQPQSQSIFANGTARLDVGATGEEPLSYLWQKDGEPLRSETGPTLVIEYATADAAGQYAVVVSNPSGEETSEAATVEVKPVEGLETARQLYLRFDETSGTTAADDTANGNDGELFDFPGDNSQWVSGQVENALEFAGSVDGMANVVSVASDDSLGADLGDEVTFAFWINPANYGESEDAGNYTRSSSYILRKGDHYGIRLVGDPGSVQQTILVRAGEGVDSGGVPRNAAWEVGMPQGTVLLDAWQHFAIVYRNETITMYKDGFRVGEAEPGVLGPANDDVLSIGDYDDLLTSPRLLNGVLDELAIWNRPLDEEEILALAGRDASGPPAIVTQPASQKRIEGTTAVFEVFVTGKRPLAFQWFRNGQPIEGADQSKLTLGRLAPSDAGEYAVTVTNSEGEDTSDVATLEVEEVGAITSGLVAYYSFDDESGDILTDSSGNDLHGAMNNMDDTARITGQIGGAFQFDGVDDFIVVDHNELLNMTTDATVSVWLNVDGMSSAAHDRVIRKATNFDFVLIGNGVVRTYGIGKTAYDGPAQSWELGIWTHFAYVYKNGTVQWYKNGEPLGALLDGQLGELTTDPLVIGNYAAGLDINRPYVGSADDLGIWQRALTPSDLLGIYVNGLQGKPLNEEFEPLNIRTLTTTGTEVEIQYYSPFANREIQVQRKDDLGNPDWAVETDATIVDQGEGLYLATLPAGGNQAAFYQVVALPPPPLFFDDFEGDPQGWTSGGLNNNWEIGPPQQGPSAAYSGENVYGTGLDENVPANASAWIRTPAIDLSDLALARVSYAEWRNVDDIVDFHWTVVNVLDATSGDLIEEITRDAGNTGSAWVERSFRLTGASVGQRIILEFRISTDTENLREGWFIDDVLVTE